MNEEQLNKFLNGELHVILKGLDEVKDFIKYCRQHNIKCYRGIKSTIPKINYSDNIYVCTIKNRITFFHQSVYSPFYKPTIIHFSNNKVNNNTNKLTSWIKSKGE